MSCMYIWEHIFEWLFMLANKTDLIHISFFFSVLSSAPGLDEVQTLLSVIHSNEVGAISQLLPCNFMYF